MEFSWVIRIIEENWRQFLSGAWTTLYIALIGTIIGLGIGLMIGVIRTIPVAESGWKKHVYNVVNFFAFMLHRNFPRYTDDRASDGHLLRGGFSV